MTDRRVVVVDGSNLATEGRTIPSLHQLDDAVRAYALEDPDAEIVVVVDASFEHRVGPEERAQLEEAELHGEVVSPPAGAIGRGDAFVLRIAERTGASVLSNDSFQEFHGEHPWLFDTGRLIGGKPVPGIGWIFTPRIPVRGPKSRQATSKAARASTGEPLSPPVKAAELAKAARKAAAKRMAVLPDGSTPKVGDVWGEPAGGPEGSAVAAGPEGPEAEAPGAPRPAKGAKAKSGRAEKAKGGTASTTTAGGRAAKKVRPAAEVVVPDEIEIEDATGEVAAKAVRSGQPARSRGKKAAVPRKAAGAAGGGPAEGVDTPSGGGPG
ncbi:MAG: NYN domain-containing protein, partial [Acidimicrobiales bacterium]